MFISLTVLLCISTIFVEQIKCSSIPMWENLRKQEKMSYLYAMFGNQVEKFCEYSEMQNCNQELLKYGLNKLKDMPEDHLNDMDPYQRDANNLIWDSMMEGHEMMRTTTKVYSTTTPQPNSYDDDLSFGVDQQFDNVYRVPPPKDFVYIRPTSKVNYNIKIGRPEYKYPSRARPQNEIFDQDLKPSASIDRYDWSFQPEVPLTGPMVVKVYPDGTPVQESHNMPQDEDLNQHKLFQILLPQN